MTRLATLVLLLVASAGCADPRGDLNAFISRLPDAAVDSGVDAPVLAQIPDVSGTFLMGLSVTIQPDSPLQFRMTNTLAQAGDGTARLSTRLVPLTYTDRVPVGMEYTSNDVVVDATGAFAIVLTNVSIDGTANPITANMITIPTVTLAGTIKSTDRLCGDVTGMVTSPIVLDLAGSTWSAIRVPDGATGSSLPPVEAMCPASTSDGGAE